MTEALIIICALILIFLFLIAPGHASKKKKAPFYGRNIAHRGLHEKDQTIPENSLEAFMCAVENGYGVELDVQLSRDGQVVVFHDDTLKRACGIEKDVCELTFEELKELRLFGTDETIPLFTEVLSVLNAEVPIILEIKTGRRNKELCKKTLDILKNYKGEYCIESFDPRIVTYIRFHAPKVFRGQLASPPSDYIKGGKGRLLGIVLGNTLCNFASRPQFIAYKIGKIPFPTRLAYMLGAYRVSWTSHDPANEKDADTVIFEHYAPETSYKKRKEK